MMCLSLKSDAIQMTREGFRKSEYIFSFSFNFQLRVVNSTNFVTRTCVTYLLINSTNQFFLVFQIKIVAFTLL